MLTPFFLDTLREVAEDEEAGVTDIPVDDLLRECVRRIQDLMGLPAQLSQLKSQLAIEKERNDRWQVDYDNLSELWLHMRNFIDEHRHFYFPEGVELAQEPVGDNGVIFEEVLYQVSFAPYDREVDNTIRFTDIKES